MADGIEAGAKTDEYGTVITLRIKGSTAETDHIIEGSGTYISKV